MTDPKVDPAFLADCIKHASGLDDVTRKVYLEEVREAYGSALADRIARHAARQVAQEAGLVVGWDGQSFINITTDRVALWEKAYPCVNIRNELAKAAAWIAANPGGVKSRFDRFITNWLSKAMASIMSKRRSTGRITATELAVMFAQQHDATRICPAEDLTEHLKRSPVGTRYIVDWLFDEMLRLWGGSAVGRIWAGVPLDQVKNTFAGELSGIPPSDIRTGVAMMRQRSFPPSIPEFVGLCRPERPVESVYMEAARLCAQHQHRHDVRWPSAAVYWTCEHVGFTTMAESSWEQVKAIFAPAYAQNLLDERFGNIRPVPEGVLRVQAQSSCTRDSELAARSMEQIRQSLGMRSSQAGQEGFATGAHHNQGTGEGSNELGATAS